MGSYVKSEAFDPSELLPENNEVISLSSSSHSSSGSSSDDDMEQSPRKKQRIDSILPAGFLDPIRPVPPRSTAAHGGAGVSNNSIVKVKEEIGENESSVSVAAGKGKERTVTTVALMRSCKQFWKAGDYEGGSNAGGEIANADMDHVRVHPKFLHSNATSHKWALGAFAELLDNALDEVCNGATYVHVDVLANIKDNNRMVVVQDNGGGMTPDKLRQCMSLGYSVKSKMANTIGQYGNGFKTSTMRLGADVIVFTRCQGKYGDSTTQSIGLLSYTFLQNTGKEDIVVPMVDFEKMGETWNRRVKSSSYCWNRNLDTILQWCPYETEDDLLRQFNFLEEQGTRIIIYNLWEDDEGSPELDFDTDPYDIQIRGVNRDEDKIKKAKDHPSARHFLTYRHSFRSYTSILYRTIPAGFHIILRGKDVEYHNIVDDMMYTKQLVYKPAAYADAGSKDPNMVAVVTLGFIKDATKHIDVQGFNVYHKNRLIKPFWRVWNAAGSDGRGVIGVLEANFVEPAHDKQGFEHTIGLSRLESRLKDLQKNYWSTQCVLIGYAPRRHSKKPISPEKESSAIVRDKPSHRNKSVSPEKQASAFTKESLAFAKGKSTSRYYTNGASSSYGNGEHRSSAAQNHNNPSSSYQAAQYTDETAADGSVPFPSITDMVLQLKEENHTLKKRLRSTQLDLEYEQEKNRLLQNQIQDMKQNFDQLDREQDKFVKSFSEERTRRDEEEHNLRRRLKDASETIDALLRKVKKLESASGFR